MKSVPFQVTQYTCWCLFPGCMVNPDKVVIEHCGQDRWAIRNFPAGCLNHAGQWEDEPQPSSRDEAFLARCRWTLAEAVEVLVAMGAK